MATTMITVGRIVHYAGGEEDDRAQVHHAAIVTQVHSGVCIDVVVFESERLSFRKLVLHVSEGTRPGYDPGTWHWPEMA